MFQTEDQHGRL